jgi:hypothetical protein
MKSHLQMQQNTTDLMLLVFLPTPPPTPGPPLGTNVGLVSSAAINLYTSSSEDHNASLFDIQMQDKLYFFIWEEKKWGLQKKILYSKENNGNFVSGGVLCIVYFFFFVLR